MRMVLLFVVIPFVFQGYTASAGDAIEGVTLLVYFSPEDFHWLEVFDVDNAFEALLKGAGVMGWEVEWENSTYGTFITAIGGVRTPPDYSYFWAFLTWNYSSGSWEYSSKSVDSASVKPGDNIAFFYCRSYGDLPDPTADYRNPVLTFHGLLNPPSPAWEPRHFRINRTVHLDAGPIDSSPLITDRGVIIFTSGVMNYSTFNLEMPSRLYLLSEDGEVRWYKNVGGVGFELSTPLVWASKVFVASTDGNLYIFNLTGGELQRKIHLDNSTWGITASPVADEKCIYVAGGDGNLTALSPDGEVRWRIYLNTTFYFSSPVAVANKVFLGGRDGKVFALNSSTGEVLFQQNLNGTVKAPFVKGTEDVYFSLNREGGGVIYRIDTDTFHIRKVKEFQENLTSSLNLFQSEEKRIVAAGFDEGLYLLDIDTGETQVLPANGPVSASASRVGDEILMVTNTCDGENASTLYLYADNGTLLDTFTPLPGTWIFPAPLLHNSRLYMPTDAGNLHIIDLLPEFMFSPGDASVVVEEGDNITFAILNPPEGGDVSICWYVDGEHVGNGENVTLSFSSSGPHNVTAVVYVEEGKYLRTWSVNVEKVGSGEDGEMEEGRGEEGGVAPAYYLLLTVSVLLLVGIYLLYRRGSSPRGGNLEE